jgi:glutaminase
MIAGDVDATLHVYFALCSLTAGVPEASHLTALLAHAGVVPGSDVRQLSKVTVAIVVSQWPARVSTRRGAAS